MAAAIFATEVIDATRIWFDQQGWHATRMWKVKGLDNTQGHKRLYDAQEVPGIPNLYSPHPDPRLAIVASKIDVESAGSGSSCNVVVSYDPIGVLPPSVVSETANPGAPGGGSISIRSGLRRVQTNKDENGKMVILRHKDSFYPDNVPVGANNEEAIHLKGELIEQPAVYEKFIHVDIIGFVRREPRHPRSKQDRYLGHVDPAQVFRGDPSRAWLCTILNGESPDGGQTYNVTYEFERAVDLDPQTRQLVSGWDPVVSFYDSQKGQFLAKPGTVLVNERDRHNVPIIGQRTIRYLPEADFSELNLFAGLSLPGTGSFP